MASKFDPHAHGMKPRRFSVKKEEQPANLRRSVLIDNTFNASQQKAEASNTPTGTDSTKAVNGDSPQSSEHAPEQAPTPQRFRVPEYSTKTCSPSKAFTIFDEALQLTNIHFLRDWLYIVISNDLETIHKNNVELPEDLEDAEWQYITMVIQAIQDVCTKRTENVELLSREEYYVVMKKFRTGYNWILTNYHGV